jgi:hypothetical protein
MTIEGAVMGRAGEFSRALTLGKLLGSFSEAMKHSLVWRRKGLGLVLAFGMTGAAAELKLLPGGEIFLVGNKSGKVPVTIENSSRELKSAEVRYRLFQASSATLAPLGETVSLGRKEFPQEQAAVFSIAVTPPEVRTITRCVLKIYADGEELGVVNFDICPQKLLARLTALVEAVALHEPDNLLRQLLDENGVKVWEAETEPKPKVVMVRLPNQEAEAKWKNETEVPHAAILFIVGRGVTGSERLLPVKLLNDSKNRRIAVVQEWFVPDLKENALSQLRFLRAIELLVQPDKERAPAPGKPATD